MTKQNIEFWYVVKLGKQKNKPVYFVSRYRTFSDTVLMAVDNETLAPNDLINKWIKKLEQMSKDKQKICVESNGDNLPIWYICHQTKIKSLLTFLLQRKIRLIYTWLEQS